MRSTYLSSLVFALITTVSMAVTAAPADVPVAAKVAVTEGAKTPSTSAPARQSTDKINLNSADAATLQKEMIGIGKNKADAIVAYREANGQFSSVDELVEVKGIGKAILEKNRDRLIVQ